MNIQNVEVGVKKAENDPSGFYLILEKDVTEDLIKQMVERGYVLEARYNSPDSYDTAVYPSKEHYNKIKDAQSQSEHNSFIDRVLSGKVLFKGGIPIYIGDNETPIDISHNLQKAFGRPNILNRPSVTDSNTSNKPTQNNTSVINHVNIVEKYLNLSQLLKSKSYQLKIENGLFKVFNDENGRVLETTDINKIESLILVLFY
jgi:hypothetical protein